ncbi:tRNA lysidine(34) synthetase TilS [Liquorilactobacillus sicerae]|uniref:tRNA lysidine(34) synthetase TilS n=1 Tax=Liquorilactobacillus sicerae TaxID=1416943 RepID=UPI00248034A8|nr:tRNA lysidine(34) synthetase TilS [Liquorilactobacillus sicerae]
MEFTDRFLKSFNLTSHSSKVLAAVSTGVDSTVMLDLLLHLPKAKRPQIYVAYVDHQLRKESKEESKYLKDFCAKHDLKLFSLTWPIEIHPTTGIEAAARKFRYDFFKKIMHENNINELLTAHHLDDQIETFLMKLIRGGRLAQLEGIKPRTEFSEGLFLLRPLLPFTKNELRQYAKKKHLKYFEDQTNYQTNTLRNRLRQIVIPELIQENSGFKDHVIDFMQQLGLDEELLNYEVQKNFNNIRITHAQFSLDFWQSKSELWKQKLLEKVFETNVKKFKREQLGEAKNLLENKFKPQGRLDLGNGYEFYKDYNFFGILKKNAQKLSSPQEYETELKLGKWVKLPDNNLVGLFKTDHSVPDMDWDTEALYFSSQIKFPLKIRHRKPGDKLASKIGHQKVKKILIDQKVNLLDRKQAWIVCDQSDQPLWLIGYKKSDILQADIVRKSNSEYVVIFRNEDAL